LSHRDEFIHLLIHDSSTSISGSTTIRLLRIDPLYDDMKVYTSPLSNYEITNLLIAG